MYHTILAAVNSSEHSDQAMQEAIDVAREHGAKLHVLGVVDRRKHDEPGLGTGELVTIATQDQYNEFFVDVSRRATQAGVDVACEIRRGVPHECILDVADEIDADVIFVGRHGDHRVHVGGVGRHVQEESDREVRVVDIAL